MPIISLPTPSAWKSSSISCASFILIVAQLLAACTPSTAAVETAIAETQAAQPTATLTPTAIPSPTVTLTPIPSPTVTLAPSPTVTPTIDPCPIVDATKYYLLLNGLITLLQNNFNELTQENAAETIESIVSLKLSLEDIIPPPCAAETHTAAIALFDAYIDISTSVLLNGNISDEAMSNAILAMATYVTHRNDFKALAGIP